MKRWMAVCAYDGTDFSGWQSQPKKNTVQDHIEKRLQAIFNQAIRIHGSGRTDAGVHAKGQVFHFDAPWPHKASDLLNALRTSLPKTIQIIRLKQVPKDFHARFSVTKKRYAYNLYEGYALPTESRYCWSLGTRKLNIHLMKIAAQHLIGTHDFSAFATNSKSLTKIDPVKEIFRLDVIKRGSHIRIITEGSGYLYKMVRSLVAAIVDVGLEKLTPQEIEQILKSRRRTIKITTAPAKGLFLEKVFYS